MSAHETTRARPPAHGRSPAWRGSYRSIAGPRRATRTGRSPAAEPPRRLEESEETGWLRLLLRNACDIPTKRSRSAVLPRTNVFRHFASGHLKRHYDESWDEQFT